MTSQVTDQTTNDETPVTPEVEIEVDTGDDQANGPKQLREARQAAIDESKALRKELMEVRLESLGLDVNEGLGKAIAKEYEGPMDIDSIRTYARDEYKFDSGEQHNAADVAGQSNKLDQLDASNQPITPPQTVDEVERLNQVLLSGEATPEDAKASILAKISNFISGN